MRTDEGRGDSLGITSGVHLPRTICLAMFRAATALLAGVGSRSQQVAQRVALRTTVSGVDLQQGRRCLQASAPAGRCGQRSSLATPLVVQSARRWASSAHPKSSDGASSGEGTATAADGANASAAHKEAAGEGAANLVEGKQAVAAASRSVVQAPPLEKILSSPE